MEIEKASQSGHRFWKNIFWWPEETITDYSLPTNTQIFKSTYVAHYSNESPTDTEATDAPRHNSRKAENQTVRVVIYLVYDSSWLGFF